MAEGRPPHFVQSLERGLAVIRAFDAQAPELTLSDVARATGLTRAASRRFLLTLADLGYVRNERRQFMLTPRVLELGYAYLSSLGLPAVAEPHLEQLVADVQESSSLSVLDGEDIIYVARVSTKRILRVAISVGTRFPAHATSMGRVLLAGLPDEALDDYLQRADLAPLTRHTLTDPAALGQEIRRARGDGYALVERELEEDLRSIAAPIHDRSGSVIAALNLSTHVAGRSRDEVRGELLEPLLTTASRIEADLALAAG
jgi:IclR family pca regulon transcriptional regulator